MRSYNSHVQLAIMFTVTYPKIIKRSNYIRDLFQFLYGVSVPLAMLSFFRVNSNIYYDNPNNFNINIR